MHKEAEMWVHKTVGRGSPARLFHSTIVPTHGLALSQSPFLQGLGQKPREG